MEASTRRPDTTHVTLGTEERLQRALDIGYAYLNRRERTVSEVRGQLERKGVSGELIEAAVQAFTEQGFLDDERFARLFVADKRELEQWGSERIRRGLLARGVDRELTQRALAPGVTGDAVDAGEDDGEPSELERALQLLGRRFPTPPRERRERDRALGMLLRKGYESELALDALTAYAREAPSDAPTA
jgi:regulatory protein